MFGYRLVPDAELLELYQCKYKLARLSENVFWPNQNFVFEFLKAFVNGGDMWNIRAKFDRDLAAYVESQKKAEMERFDASI